MKVLFVWVRCPDGSIHQAGRLSATDPAPSNGRFQAEFEYAADWTGAGSFPLDPESLPLGTTSRRFRSTLLETPLGVFEDALPDDWGRSLLRAALSKGGRQGAPVDLLVQMRGGGTGALLFTEAAVLPEPLDTVNSTELSKLLVAAEKFEAGTLERGDELRLLLEGSSRAGGARPKALVHDDAGEWLVKFPSRSRDGGHDVVGLEATSLELARLAGLQVPDAHLRMIGRRRVLVVRRFDVTPQNGRLHMISLSTLCRERPGVYVNDYSTVAQTLRKHSAAPAADVTGLFRQMVFNAAIGNVDDHLKNFWMLLTGAGYRLSPAFDLVPDISGRGAHTSSFKGSSRCPSRAELMELGAEWGVEGPEAIVDAVLETASEFALKARQMEVKGGPMLEEIVADVRKRTEWMSLRSGP